MSGGRYAIAAQMNKRARSLRVLDRGCGEGEAFIRFESRESSQACVACERMRRS